MTDATTPEPRTAAGREHRKAVMDMHARLLGVTDGAVQWATNEWVTAGILAIEAQARPAVASEGLRAALLADLTALAHWSPEEWAERGQGGDPIARTINAARDIVEARLA